MAFYKCSICRSSFGCDDSVCSTICGHVFHKECLLEWLSTNPICPNCRSACSWSSSTSLYFSMSFDDTILSEHKIKKLENKLEEVTQDRDNKIDELDAMKKKLANAEKKLTAEKDKSERKSQKFMGVIKSMKVQYDAALNSTKTWEKRCKEAEKVKSDLLKKLKAFEKEQDKKVAVSTRLNTKSNVAIETDIKPDVKVLRKGSKNRATAKSATSSKPTTTSSPIATVVQRRSRRNFAAMKTAPNALKKEGDTDVGSVHKNKNAKTNPLKQDIQRQVAKGIAKKENSENTIDYQLYRVRNRNVNGELRSLRTLRNNNPVPTKKEKLNSSIKLECEEITLSFS